MLFADMTGPSRSSRPGQAPLFLHAAPACGWLGLPHSMGVSSWQLLPQTEFSERLHRSWKVSSDPTSEVSKRQFHRIPLIKPVTETGPRPGREDFGATSQRKGQQTMWGRLDSTASRGAGRQVLSLHHEF